MFIPGSITWRELPLTLKAQLVDEDGHTGAIIAGRIDTITRVGAEIVGTGVWDTSPEAQNVRRLVADQTLRGVSVDIAPLEWEYEVPAMIDPMPVEEVPVGEEVPNDAGDDENEPTITINESVDDYMMRVIRGEIGAVTVCTFPAFAEGVIEALVADGRPLMRVTRTFAPTEKKVAPRESDPTKPAEKVPGSDGAMIAMRPLESEADRLAKPGGHAPADMHVTLAHLTPDAETLSPEDDEKIKKTMAAVAAEHPPLTGKVGGSGSFSTPDGYANVHLADVPHIGRMRESLTAGLREQGVPYSADHGFTPHITSHYSDDIEAGDPAAHGVGLSFSTLEYHKGGQIVHTEPLNGLPVHSLTAAAAGAVPVEPPREWFYLEEADGPTPLTITADGQVYGHIAEWGTCHIAYPDACVEPPPSRSGYAYFHLGEVLCEDGSRVACGTFTMGTGHAASSYGRQKAAEHYDNTGVAAADIRVVDGVWGPWACGAIRPDLSVERLRALRAAKPSGDWREINGELDMIGTLAVNIPGFPVVRPQVLMAAGGVRKTLIAGGSMDPHLTERWLAARAAFYTPDEVSERLAELATQL